VGADGEPHDLQVGADGARGQVRQLRRRGDGGHCAAGGADGADGQVGRGGARGRLRQLRRPGGGGGAARVLDGVHQQGGAGGPRRRVRQLRRRGLRGAERARCVLGAGFDEARDQGGGAGRVRHDVRQRHGSRGGGGAVALQHQEGAAGGLFDAERLVVRHRWHGERGRQLRPEHESEQQEGGDVQRAVRLLAAGAVRPDGDVRLLQRDHGAPELATVRQHAALGGTR